MVPETPPAGLGVGNSAPGVVNPVLYLVTPGPSRQWIDHRRNGGIVARNVGDVLVRS
ncbi:hypothetical protein DAPPUDRAFT_276358 [Daphnia pulex]|uniref:Uncharacterized protein n=1 Tax=Daphnia pulex TaxID=6669 RepID=E9I5T5_DAPPU|nr:hypothetical protein DAPPUDRAFT_276358 [Daphnia pulex]|eukprot:EFX60645.1 hypothetical protein DAPPUDRAFT_276358 [Daphnia pulex]